MKISDLSGLSKPLTRLIEVISQGVGSVCTPYLIRKTAEAKAYEIKVIANALQEVREKNHLPVIYDAGTVEVWQKPEDSTLILDTTSPEQRIATRLEFKHRKRQKNIEKVTTSTAAELSREKDVPDERPDDDWVFQFFEHAQDVSDGDMQQLWARLLAGEINKPGSFSLRTLNCLKAMTKPDAELFTRLISFSWTNSMGTAFIMDTEVLRRHWNPELPPQLSSMSAKSAIEHMKHVGLLGPSPTVYPVSALSAHVFYYFGRTFVFDIPAEKIGGDQTIPSDLSEAKTMSGLTFLMQPEFLIGETYFTQTGLQLRKLAAQIPVPKYAEEEMDYESKQLRVPFREVAKKETSDQ
jgi:hypothetical protein